MYVKIAFYAYRDSHHFAPPPIVEAQQGSPDHEANGERCLKEGCEVVTRDEDEGAAPEGSCRRQ